MNQSELSAELYSRGIADGAEGKPCQSTNVHYLKGHIVGMELRVQKRASLDRIMNTISYDDKE